MMRKIFDKIKAEMPDAIITSDMSSAIVSRNLEKGDLWKDLGVVYAGAQKNIGTSGLTFVCIRNDVLDKVSDIKKN